MSENTIQINTPTQEQIISQKRWLKRLSFLTSFLTLFLIFAGGLVTSTGSGLAVPDWPLSYGMVFPPMVGGVFYEHGHRMVATTVGFLMLCLATLVGIYEKRYWVRRLGFIALGTVILQGILGGITVRFFLPTPVSVFHAVLAQTFFLLTIVLAYSQSQEHSIRSYHQEELFDGKFLRLSIIFLVCSYIQLTIGAVMRHTSSGLAIPDFPTMGGEWVPKFDNLMLSRINDWQFENDKNFVTMPQVVIHFFHRLGALVILTVLLLLNKCGLERFKSNRNLFYSMVLLDIAVAIQIFLGIITILSVKEPYLTSIHVVTGAGILGLTMLLILRASPLSIQKFKQIVNKKF